MECYKFSAKLGLISIIINIFFMGMNISNTYLTSGLFLITNIFMFLSLEDYINKRLYSLGVSFSLIITGIFNGIFFNNIILSICLILLGVCCLPFYFFGEKEKVDIIYLWSTAMFVLMTIGFPISVIFTNINVDLIIFGVGSISFLLLSLKLLKEYM